MHGQRHTSFTTWAKVIMKVIMNVISECFGMDMYWAVQGFDGVYQQAAAVRRCWPWGLPGAHF
jgi:hypothetical protein